MFTSLHHLIDSEWMREAYRRTRKDGATGIDGVTAADYEKDLEGDLDGLLDRIKSGRYFAPPVRRRYIPKADGTKRPLGIPTLEDKVAQRTILMLLEPGYEADFLPCSYGFRPGRSAHDALNALRNDVIGQRQRWVIDADLSSYFDSIPHGPYYGLTGNGKRLEWFRYQVARIWRKWLSRRSRLRRLNWDRMNALLKRYPLPYVTFSRSWRQRVLNEPVR